MKKKQLYAFVMICTLLIGLITGTGEANAADTQLNRSPKHNMHLFKAGAKDYHLNYQKHLLIDESATLKIEGDLADNSVSFKSSDSSVLNIRKVSENTCTYTGKSSGTATLTVRIRSNKNFFQNKTITLKAKISVSPRAVSIKFRQAKIKMTVGQKKKIKTIIRPSISKEQPLFTSADPEIAYFQNQNFLRAKQVGSTYITASISNGMKVRCKVIVKNKPNTP